MNEKSSKRREWVQSGAIVLLWILLLLTFFSQTILNHSLPEVATKTIQSGTITSKVRGNGPVESGDPYTIEIPANYVGRKVTSINLRAGDKVTKGDVLMTL
ncbi:MAG: RND transporter, partial [Lachnospiraceae bacterium]|nr:RND transporter [Lachnospiraceae bacterium]